MEKPANREITNTPGEPGKPAVLRPLIQAHEYSKTPTAA